MTDEFAINILEQYREKPTLINEIETVEEAIWLDEALAMGIQALKQKSKTGHWIPLGNYDDYGDESTYKCSECGDIDGYPDNYCSNCGCRMVDPTCDTCKYNTAAFNPCNACEDKSEYEPRDASFSDLKIIEKLLESKKLTDEQKEALKYYYSTYSTD
jgi:hypothetical protein